MNTVAIAMLVTTALHRPVQPSARRSVDRRICIDLHPVLLARTHTTAYWPTRACPVHWEPWHGACSGGPIGSGVRSREENWMQIYADSSIDGSSSRRLHRPMQSRRHQHRDRDGVHRRRRNAGAGAAELE